MKMILKTNLPVDPKHKAVKGCVVDILSFEFLGQSAGRYVKTKKGTAVQMIWFKTQLGKCCAFYYEVEIIDG